MALQVSFKYDSTNERFVTDTQGREPMSIRDPFTSKEIYHTPTELLLLGMGGCSSDDILLILKKRKNEVSDFRCEVTGTRAETDPKTLTYANIHYIINGKVDKDSARKAIDLSLSKYCSVSILAKRGGTDLRYSLTLNGKKIAESEKA